MHNFFLTSSKVQSKIKASIFYKVILVRKKACTSDHPRAVSVSTGAYSKDDQTKYGEITNVAMLSKHNSFGIMNEHVNTYFV